MEKQEQVVFIHGGETFDSYEDYLGYLRECEFDPEKAGEKGWKDSLEERLGEDFEVIAPTMPCKFNARYEEWRIWFNKVVPFLKNGVILIGHSLGGIFLAKYLSENDFPRKISATYLIAAPYDAEDSEYSLADFALPESLKNFHQQGREIFIFHSEDDPVVPFQDSEKYLRAMPGAEKANFKNREHFSQEEFPELVESIKRTAERETPCVNH
ncbi:MAG: alpha/beta hydrolase [bacterium]|nr:alpha/beta hydrolase [bacterium]